MGNSINPKNLVDIDESIKNAWDSLESHLPWIHEKKYKGMTKKQIRIHGNAKFHKEAIKEYVQIIKTLTDLL